MDAFVLLWLGISAYTLLTFYFTWLHHRRLDSLEEKVVSISCSLKDIVVVK